MSYEVSICDRQRTMQVDLEGIERAVREVLHAEQVAAAVLSIALVDDATIHELNRTHLNHDYPTDVLSFLLETERDGGTSQAGGPPGRGLRIEGEVVASAETAVREAERFGWDAASELLLYVVHGVLHLCGYDDRTNHQRSRMRQREAAVLQNQGLTPHYE